MSVAKGVQKHGQVTWDALKSEFEPLDAFTMSDKHKSEALRALSVIKEKRCGKIKGCTVADGSAQRGKYSKQETGSPTVSSDPLS
jgi:hypothetical protein